MNEIRKTIKADARATTGRGITRRSVTRYALLALLCAVIILLGAGAAPPHAIAEAPEGYLKEAFDLSSVWPGDVGDRATLYVKKTTPPELSEEEFDFEITFDYINLYYFTLKNGQYVALEGIPEGVFFDMIENGDICDATVTSSGTIGSFTPDPAGHWCYGNTTGSEATITFYNYLHEMSIELHARKSANEAMAAEQFAFDLYKSNSGGRRDDFVFSAKNEAGASGNLSFGPIPVKPDASPAYFYYLLEEDPAGGGGSWATDPTLYLYEVKIERDTDSIGIWKSPVIQYKTSADGGTTWSGFHAYSAGDPATWPAFANKYLYHYSVEYYHDSIVPGNRIGLPVVGGTSFEEGYVLTAVEVAHDLGPSWLNQRRPEHYGSGSTDSFTLTISVDEASNVIRVLYTPDPAYHYSVEYYKDSIEPGNMIELPIVGATSFDEGHELTAAEVADDLGPLWLNLRRPEHYGSGSTDSFIVIISTDEARNVIKVLYTPDPAYHYSVEYYKDSVEPGNRIELPVVGATSFEEGYILTAAEVADDLGPLWLDLRKPENYGSGNVQRRNGEYYPVISVDDANNVVIVLYVASPGGNQDPDDPPDEGGTKPNTSTGGGGEGGGGEDKDGGEEDKNGGDNHGGEDGGNRGGGEQNNPPDIPGGSDREAPPNPMQRGNTLVQIDEGGFIEFDDDGVPLGEWRWSEDEGQWIFNEYPPLGLLPQTGYHGIPIRLILLYSLSLIGFGIVFRSHGLRGVQRNRR